MAKLAAVVESLDAIEDEGARKFYTEQDGKFVLDADVEGHPAVAGLKSTVKAVRGEKELTAKELKAYKDLGFTPEQIAELKEKADRVGKDNPDFEKLLDKRIKEVETKYAKDIEERDALRKENRTLKLTDKVRAAFLASGGRKADADLAVLDTEAVFDLNDKGKIVVLDEDGDPTGKTPEQYFAEVYKAKRPNLFEGSGASGSGARGGAGGSGADSDVRKLPGARMVEAAFAGGGK